MHLVRQTTQNTKNKMTTDNNLLLKKRIARLRHTQTLYDKHWDLMFDKDGNQTELRLHLNKILAKIARGELSYDYLAGLNQEIKLAQQALIKENRLKKLRKKKPSTKKLGSIEKQQAALLRGVKKMQESGTVWRNPIFWKYLNAIGMRPHQLHKLYRKALPKY